MNRLLALGVYPYGFVGTLIFALFVVATFFPAYAVNGTWNYSITAPSNVALDSTIFTGTQTNTPNGGDTIIANITGCTGPGDCTLGGGSDSAKFKVVAARAGLVGGACPGGQSCPAGWINSANGGPRKGPFLMSAGNQPAQANGYNITLNGTAFHLGDPTAPSTSGAVVVSAGGNIQNAINGAGGGVPIFLNCGSYGSGFSANGHNVISATVQNHVNGQTCRAIIHGSVDISGGTVYGIDIEGCGNPCLTGSNGTLTNSIVNMGDPSGNWFCQGGGFTLSWDTLITALGADGGCGGGIPLTLDHVHIFDCYQDCIAGDYGGNGALTMTNTFCDVNNITGKTTSSGGNLLSCIEDGIHDNAATVVENNYVLNAGTSSCCGGWAWSLIGKANEHPIGPGPFSFRFNYQAGWHEGIEWNVRGSPTAQFTDNYFDGVNIQVQTDPWQQTGVTNGTGNYLGTGTMARNNEIPSITDSVEVACNNPPACGLAYTPGNTINVGIPAPFASGASSP